MPTLTDVFADNGTLSRAISGYKMRSEQLLMAEKIAETIKKNGMLVAEAGTGTGKTFAYLVPALLSGGKVIVSTGTKNLQDQLFLRDLPTVRDVLNVPIKIALLKGRANYLCHYYLERTQSEGRFGSKKDASDFAKITRFAKATKTGDKTECAGVSEVSPVWNQVTSTRDNCLGQECAYYKECFVMNARKAALAADLVVVNHHLFFADVMLRDEGVSELLPACNTVIFDEAHQLPETASLFFGQKVSTFQVQDLTRDTKVEALISAKDCLDLPKFCDALDKKAKDLRLTLPLEPTRFSLAQLRMNADFENAFDNLLDTFKSFAELLNTQAERSEGLDKCSDRAEALIEAFNLWKTGEKDNAGFVRWGETYTHALQLNSTPLAIDSIMQKEMGGHPRAWIFTSATLAVRRDFHHYCEQMGLMDAEVAFWESPFDYAKQALLYVPIEMPDPNAPNFSEALVNMAFPVVKASGGRAFFLCTSLRAMRKTHELLTEKLTAEGLDFPLLLQGDGSKNELLERFRSLGNAILVASQSFWEGVDVRGDALSLVVIDKLPFAPPDDPVLAARIEEMRKKGQNPFMEYQLPRTVISVKQGAGRLIRDNSDRGVLMIGDPRIITKPYGKQIWQSLPPMKRTRQLAEVMAFFNNTQDEETAE